jgi:hypothetical protein
VAACRPSNEACFALPVLGVEKSTKEGPHSNEHCAHRLHGGLHECVGVYQKEDLWVGAFYYFGWSTALTWDDNNTKFVCLIQKMTQFAIWPVVRECHAQ